MPLSILIYWENVQQNCSVTIHNDVGLILTVWPADWASNPAAGIRVGVMSWAPTEGEGLDPESWRGNSSLFLPHEHLTT